MRVHLSSFSLSPFLSPFSKETHEVGKLHSTHPGKQVPSPHANGPTLVPEMNRVISQNRSTGRDPRSIHRRDGLRPSLKPTPTSTFPRSRWPSQCTTDPAAAPSEGQVALLLEDTRARGSRPSPHSLHRTAEATVRGGRKLHSTSEDKWDQLCAAWDAG